MWNVFECACDETYALVFGMLSRIKPFAALGAPEAFRMPVKAERLLPLSWMMEDSVTE